MELDQLKNKLNIQEVRYSSDELKSIFDIRTKNVVTSINRKMLIDAAIMLVVTCTLVSTTFALGLKDKYLISGQIIMLTALLLIHYKIKYHLLNAPFLFKGGVIGAINKSFKTLHYYLAAYLFLIPTGILITFLAYINNHVSLWYSAIIWFTSLIITAALSTALYGKEYATLKKLVSSSKGH